MVSDVLGCTVVSKFLFSSSRDSQLNEKAFQRALALTSRHKIESLDIYQSVPFQISQDVSLKQIIQEKSSRERVVKMQDEINNPNSLDYLKYWMSNSFT
jgi:hypothetical protein